NDTEILDVSQINLQQLHEPTSPENIKVDISQLQLGQNHLNNTLGLKDFATFIRKEDLKYDQEHFERFVIVTINQSCISLIPFDKFNKTGGDYGYVWPAIARVDKNTKKLYGQGMRMADFEVDIDKGCI